MSWQRFLAEEPFVSKWLEGKPRSTRQHGSMYMRQFTTATGVVPEHYYDLSVSGIEKRKQILGEKSE